MAKEYIARLFDSQLDFYLRSVGAILITGPKGCGKSTTAKRHAKTIIDLMKYDTRSQYIALAKAAPDKLLNIGEKPILIDEWQVVSFLWNSIKENVDENGGFGQYILTGSVTDNTASDSLSGEENERHTGTGRMIKRMMRPLSLYESGDSNGSVSIGELKKGNFTPALSSATIDDYAFYVCRGGWPLAMGQERDVALQQAINYFEGLVGEDLFSLKDIPINRNENRARKLLRSYSRFVGSQTPDTKIMQDLSESGDDVDKETFHKYLLALQRLYAIEELEAWNPNLRSKTAIRTSNTRYFVDPSIAVSALGATPESLFMDMNTFGFLFESLAIRDLRIYCDSIRAKLFHYRDKRGLEADAVMEFNDGAWALIEVKLGDQDDIDLAADNLHRLAKDVTNNHAKPAFLMVITKDQVAYQREDGVYVVPLGCLKP